MKLMTKLNWPSQSSKIDYNSKVLLLGSCFAENIGARFEYFKFDNLVNPFGIIYHPCPLLRLIERAVNLEYFSDEGFIEQDGRWLNFSAHSKLSTTDKQELLALMNRELQYLREQLKEASHIIFTFGTAWGYRKLTSDNIVANCHKVPSEQFSKELSSVTDIEKWIAEGLSAIRSVNKQVKVILTVSPVRHLKDGMAENNRSKAHLLTAVHNCVDARDNVCYFPSYEIMMDELRDYRFYASDMLHPSELAVDHIWETFSDSWIDPHTKPLQKKIDQIRKDLSHRPFNPESQAHKAFIESLEQKISEVKRLLPGIEFN